MSIHKISLGHRHVIYLSIVRSCFGLTHADPRSCNRDHVVNKAKKIYCLDLYRRSVLTSVSKEHRNRLLPPQSSDTPSPIFSSSPPASEEDVALVLAKLHITDPHSLASSGTLTRQWCCCLLFQVILASHCMLQKYQMARSSPQTCIFGLSLIVLIHKIPLFPPPSF